MYYAFNNNVSDPFNEVDVQYQENGNWITCETVPNEPPQVIRGMRHASSIYPNNRIRAVDQNGRLVDNL